MTKDDSVSANEKLTALLIGAGIGAALALLFAPKSGRELRDDIADFTKRGLDSAGERARDLGERATERYGIAAGKISEAYDTARDKFAAGSVHGAGEGPDEGA
jgi:gas vesicle protein